MDNPKFKENDIVYYPYMDIYGNIEIKEVKVLYIIDSMYETMGKNTLPTFYCCQETKCRGECNCNWQEEINEGELFLWKSDAKKFLFQMLSSRLQKINEQEEMLKQETCQLPLPKGRGL